MPARVIPHDRDESASSEPPPKRDLLPSGRNPTSKSRAGRLHAILTNLWHLPLRKRGPDPYHRVSDELVRLTRAMKAPTIFEHLVYPWKAVLELNRVLKTGGYVFVATHPVWPAHELPWDFWRFPIAGLLHLFVRDTGFEVVTAAEGLSAKVYSVVKDPPTRGVREASVNQGVSLIARKTHDYDPDRLRWEIDVDEVVTSKYPRPR